MFGKILVPLDGSELAEGILLYVSQMARGFGANVVLLSVLKAADDESAIRQRLERVGKLLGTAGVEAESLVSYGATAEEIIRVAKDKGSDLIAMTSHGWNALGRVIFGSVTDRVIHSSNVSVLVLAPKEGKDYFTEGLVLSKMTVPLDGSQAAEKVLPYVEELAKKLLLEIELVRVIDTGGPYYGLLDDARFVEVDPAIKAEARAYLETLTASMKAEGLSVTWRLSEGQPSRVMVGLALDTPNNLVVLATRGHSGIERWLEGSVSEAVTRTSGDPVMVIPP